MGSTVFSPSVCWYFSVAIWHICFLAVDSTVSVTKKLKETHEAVSNSTINGDSEQYYQDIAFAELDMLIGKLKGTTKYKALNTIDSLTNTEKKILERVINIVETLDIDNSDAVIEAILNNFFDIYRHFKN